MENVYADIRKQEHLDIRVKIVTCRQGSGSKRAFDMTVEDIEGTRFSFTVWEKCDAGASFDWQEGHWYVLRSALGKVWPAGKELHGTTKLEIEHEGPDVEDRRAKLLYMTDTHLGKQSVEHGKTWEITPADGLEAAVDVALAEDVDAVVHTGDVFHNDTTNGVSESDVVALSEALTTLASADIPFYYILGNHEKKQGRVELERFEDAGLATHLRTRPTVVGDAVAIYGVDFQESWDPGHLGFEQPPRDVPTLLCLHQSLAPLTGSSNPDCSLSEVVTESSISIDGVALGHIHKKAEATFRECTAFCNGATERLTADLEPSVDTITVEDGELSRTTHQL